MLKAIRRHLIWKILLSYLVVVAISIGVLGLVGSLVAGSVYDRQLAEMMDSMMGPGHAAEMMGEDGMMGRMIPEGTSTEELFTTFTLATQEALAVSGIAAFITALAASVVVSRRLTRPVSAVTRASKRIAAGEYSERVPVRDFSGDGDEIDQLAESFNQMAADLERVEMMRQQLIGDVAHELRTPLATLKGSLEGLADGVLAPTSETYQQLYRETERMQKLVDDLQDLSRAEIGELDLENEPLEIGGLVRNIVERFYLQYDAKGVALEFRTQENLPSVMGDEQRVEQVVTNLLSNALAYSNPGGTVQVAVYSQEGKVLVRVQDDGIGLAPEQLKPIFDRFYRVEKSRSRGSGGSGVGLTIARYLVEAHGGDIWAESQGVGKGSTFTFSLPAA